MEKGQESKQKRKTPLTTIAISQEYAQKLDEYLKGTGITRKEFVELSVDYFQRTLPIRLFILLVSEVRLSLSYTRLVLISKVNPP